MRSVLTRAVLLAVVGLGLTEATASADMARCSDQTENRYSALYHATADQFGDRAPGRNIRKWGVRRGGGVRNATCGEVKKSIRQLQRLRAPAPPRTTVRATRPYQAPSNVRTRTVRANLPACTWRPESGGSYTAYNRSSGARGKYQVIPSTHAAHCSDLGWSPSEQEECAARVYEAQGPGAWVNCG